jgi:pimeloyl-ACP methyl ester carboxylesterase
VLTQLADIDGPLDVIGHDWGSIITLRIVTAFPDRIRSWAVDAAALLHRGAGFARPCARSVRAKID